MFHADLLGATRISHSLIFMDIGSARAHTHYASLEFIIHTYTNYAQRASNHIFNMETIWLSMPSRMCSSAPCGEVSQYNNFGLSVFVFRVLPDWGLICTCGRYVCVRFFPVETCGTVIKSAPLRTSMRSLFDRELSITRPVYVVRKMLMKSNGLRVCLVWCL